MTCERVVRETERSLVLNSDNASVLTGLLVLHQYGPGLFRPTRLIEVLREADSGAALYVVELTGPIITLNGTDHWVQTGELSARAATLDEVLDWLALTDSVLPDVLRPLLLGPAALRDLTL